MALLLFILLCTGLGRGCLSVLACGLEFEPGLLAILPMQEHPVEADGHVMHLTDQPIPKVAAAFQDYVIEHGQELVGRELEGAYKQLGRRRKPRADGAGNAG